MIKVLIKGAGDLATGVAIAFKNIGCKIVMTELDEPTVIRRSVSFASTVYEKRIVIEGIKAEITDKNNYKTILKNNSIAVIKDKEALIIKEFKPMVLIDAIMAKKNLGTEIKDANIVLALGPGFKAGKDCHLIIETKRGHNLGKLIYRGSAKTNTGIPGEILGKSRERVIVSPCDGRIFSTKKIGDILKRNEIIFKINNIKIKAPFDCCLRGALKEGLNVKKGMKIGDIDPRCKPEYCYTLSDKSRTVGRAAVDGFLKLAINNKLLKLMVRKNVY